MPVLLRWLLNLGPTNPIAVRLVQNASRRTKHLYLRTGYLLVLSLALLWVLWANVGAGSLSYIELARAGANAFTVAAYLQIGLIFILTPVFMSGAIAQEANPRTWDILLTTPIGALQIVLGNLLGRLFFVLALLFASLPLFALTQYFGGAPGTSIFGSYLIAACAALAVGSIAVALSVSRLVGKRAVFAFYVVSVSYVALTAALDAAFRPSGGGVTAFTAVNPFLAQRALLNPSGYPRGAEGAGWLLEHPVTAWCVICVALSAVLVGVSAATARLGGLAALTGRSTGAPWYRRVFKLGAAGAEHRPPRAVWANPIAWREAAARNSTLGKILSRWAFILLGGAWGVSIIIAWHTGSMSTDAFQLALLATVWGEVGVVGLIAMNTAATAVSKEREDGTLDLLLTTPLTPSQYLWGKLRGLVTYLAPLLAVPLGTLLFAGVSVLAAQAAGHGQRVEVTRQVLGSTVTAPAVLPEAGLVVALVVLPFIAFCAMVGLQWSLKSRGMVGSVVGTVGVVAAVAGTMGLCGWHAGPEVDVIGPVLSGMGPASVIFSAVEPVDGMFGVVSDGGLTPARLGLAIGAALGAAGYTLVVYLIHAGMVRNFDFTVRRLAGTR